MILYSRANLVCYYLFWPSFCVTRVTHLYEHIGPTLHQQLVIAGDFGPACCRGKQKRQYLLTLQVNRHRLLALHSSIDAPYRVRVYLSATDKLRDLRTDAEKDKRSVLRAWDADQRALIITCIDRHDTVIKHTTTLFSLSAHYILCREWRVIVDQVQTYYHGRPMVI